MSEPVFAVGDRVRVTQFDESLWPELGETALNNLRIVYAEYTGKIGVVTDVFYYDLDLPFPYEVTFDTGDDDLFNDSELEKVSDE